MARSCVQFALLTTLSLSFPITADEPRKFQNRANEIHVGEEEAVDGIRPQGAVSGSDMGAGRLPGIARRGAMLDALTPPCKSQRASERARQAATAPTKAAPPALPPAK